MDEKNHLTGFKSDQNGEHEIIGKCFDKCPLIQYLKKKEYEDNK